MAVKSETGSGVPRFSPSTVCGNSLWSARQCRAASPLGEGTATSSEAEQLTAANSTVSSGDGPGTGGA